LDLKTKGKKNHDGCHHVVIGKYNLINRNTNNLKEKTMNRKKIIIGSFGLIAVLVFFVFSGMAINRSNTSHEVEAGDLTTLDAAEISAYRWNAMAKFYAANSEQVGTAMVDLTTLDAAEISAYRWNAMAKFYAANVERMGTAKVDLTTLDAAEISAYRWNAMAKFYAAQNESQAE
jgi:hypothetical protein